MRLEESARNEPNKQALAGKHVGICSERCEVKIMRRQLHVLGLVVLILAGLLTGRVQAQQATVRAVLFYSPSCGHCHYVITEVLQPLVGQYGDRLQVAGVNTSTSEGQALYLAAVKQFNIPDERRGVPLLIVDSTTLVGSLEIPQQFPALIEHYLAQGGVDWPALPGLAATLAASTTQAQPTAEPTAEPAPAAPSPAAEAVPLQSTAAPVAAGQEAVAQAGSSTRVTADPVALSAEPEATDLLSKLRRDPAGNLLAILLLAGMLVVLAYAAARALRARPDRAQGAPANNPGGWRAWAVAGLCLAGLGVSIYMAFVETTHTTAVCGPIGDCNTVQQSEYALLFGRLPVGVLGVLGYASMLLTWFGWRWGRGRLGNLAGVALFAMALGGTLFSIYLTFLEPFVIGATCAWCLTSALCMTLILLILAGLLPARPEPAARQLQGNTR